MMKFAPIAIVGRACRVPGASSPEALWRLVAAGESALSEAPAGRWRAPDSDVMSEVATEDHAYSKRGGYVETPDGGLDPVFTLSRDVVREALQDGGGAKGRVGLVMGNLGFPSEGHSRFAEAQWLGERSKTLGIAARPEDRFHSGLPAHLIARELGFAAGGYSLDAACASSLYAIELACRSLQEGRSDMMVAGAVNRADDLFIHVGFSALGALSASGQSRPFDADADGLLPGEGAAFVTLMRLEDARREGRVIHGVIRGVGLANDGRGRGLLAPTSGGQVMSMTKALTQAGLTARDVPYVECHATGTQVGDATELASLAKAYGESPLVVGSLKANLGHLITAAGAAGLIKVLEAMRHGVFPVTPGVSTPTPALAEAGCRLANAGEAWSGPKRAAVSAFGFGGNDAHLIVEDVSLSPATASAGVPLVGRLAIVGLGARVGSGQNAADLLSGCAPRAESVTLPLRGLRFPPNDLKHTLAQQTLLLAAAFEALDGLELPAERTGVFVGMGCDSDVTRYGARWRSKGWSRKLGENIEGDAFIHGLKSAGVIGTMPNIPANRLSSQFDLRGPSFTFSAEEGSGAWALAAARRALLAGEIDVALVGAVDIASDDVTRAALSALGREDGAADGAVLVVLVREGDAASGGAYALLDEAPAEGPLSKSPLPRAHAAAFMVDLAYAAASAASAGSESTLRVSPLGAPQGTTPAFTLLPVPEPKALSAWEASAPVLTRPVHYPQVSLPPIVHSATATATAPSSTRARTSMQSMAPAPKLPSVFNEAPANPPAAPIAAAQTAAQAAAPAPAAPAPAAPSSALARPPARPASHGGLQVAALGSYQANIAAMHRAFVEQQVALHQQFLAMQAHANQTMMQMRTHASTPPAMQAPRPAAQRMPAAQAPITAPAPRTTAPRTAAPRTAAPRTAAPAPRPALHAPVSAPLPATTPVVAPVAAVKPVASVAPAKPVAAKHVAAPAVAKPAAKTASGKRAPVGPTFDRAALAIHAGGRISEIFGAEFRQQDVHDVQVRMPEPPLLLADRVTGIDAEPGSMEKGTVWTETDVLPDSWYLHRGRMPAGVMIESGQADLFLISYLGVDFLNCGERAYRLLGCELTYHGALPKIGETLVYDIHVDGHANQGDIRLFFFHYDCELRSPDGSLRPALSVRNGQAGFFTKEELAESAGVLWSPEEQEIVQTPRLDKPAVNCTKTSFNEEDLAAFAAGDVSKCFGPGFEYAAPHNRTPRIAGHKMHFFDRVDECLPQGGPWGRGYLRATLDIAPSDWFFVGHFKNDPCMPGTLMFEGCLQAMATFVTSLGYTLDKDGWRFEPVPEEKYALRCRSQVLPTSKKLTYEIFVEEIVEGPIPTLYADLLCTIDGHKAFHARRMALRLVPDWPLEEWRKSPPSEQDPSCAPALTGEVQDAIVMLDKPAPTAASAVWALDPSRRDFVFDYASLLACAWGRPSEAFGPMYEIFDSTRRVARLPGPPYHFMSRVTRIDGELGACKPGAEIEIAYDVPENIWYFNENAQAVMPFAVLLEAALQPCGWLASFVGSALTVGDKDVSFRNLDGTGTVLTEVFPSMGTFRTVVKITNVSSTAGMIIESFDVMSYVDHADGTSTPAYKLKTVFGFFPGAALENQIGLSTTDEQRALLEVGSPFRVDLIPRPERYCSGSLRMAEPMLLMVDRITACDAKGGREGLGFVRGEKDVDAAEWFFKAHFFQDPVQPGSLGIEAFLQLMQFFAIEENLGEGMKAPRFEAIAINHEHSWKYRGQVVPKNKVIGSTVEILEITRDEVGVLVVGAASLWVDGKRIYEAPAIGIRVVDGMRVIDGGLPSGSDGGSESTPQEPKRPKADAGVQPASPQGAVLLEEVLSLESTPWVKDHCPTFSVAALPLMTLVDRFVAAAKLDAESAQLRDVRVMRWVTVAPEAKIRVEQHGDELRLLMWREAAEARLSRFEVAATARLGAPAPMLELAPLSSSEVAEDPYENGSLFHGEAFRLLKELRVGPDGADGWLDAATPAGANGSVPIGTVHQALLDAATHVIPHDALHTWSDAIPDDVVAYPYELDLSFCGPLPTGRVKCSARLEEVRTDPRLLPVIRIDLFDEARNAMWARLRMTEVLLPKGPLGSAPRDSRLRFMREREYVPGVGLSEASANDDGSTSHRAYRDTVSQSGWLPGTVQSLYGSTASTLDALTRDVSIGDHIAARAACHPSRVGVREHGVPEGGVRDGSTYGFDRSKPLRSFPFISSVEREHTTATSSGGSFVDFSDIEDFWAERFGLREWPIADLYYGLCKQFVKDVVIEDPVAFDAITGQSALFLGNHQTGIESLLFGILAGGLQKTPILTLAKDAHRQSWLGRLIALGFEYPGAHDPGVIAFFNREDPASLPRIVKGLSSMAASSSNTSQRSLLVHVEGTRQLSARQPMDKMSGVFVDLALVGKLPIVPVSFGGGLPVRALNERIEFPIGLGQQTFSLGKPIYPDELRGVPYKERTERVLRAIGDQRPRDETPGPAQGDLSARVGAITPQRVARAVLESLEDPCEATRAALAGEDHVGGAEGEWLRKFGAWLNS
ncbi:MAG: 3-oxoacyl-(acyl-carrier-protein) synthase/3-hydroxymyristoyl [Polyangiales bacterium]|jgi:3-oxoacyl-(acyl-carrier-protein) synthase/3-hydroxymyristoyl/3-hydroxydecanoyl-(acyl carrier protein) dehydratase